MKTKFIILVFLFTCGNLVAQYTFEKIISSEPDKVINDIVEANNKYLLAGKIRNVETNKYQGYVVEMQNNGEILKEIELSNGTGASMFFNLHTAFGKFYLLGTQWVNENESSKLWFLELDSNLTITKQKLFNLPAGHWFSHMNSIIDSDTNLIISGYMSSQVEGVGYRTDPGFYKIDLQGDSVASFFMWNTQRQRYIYDVLESKDSSMYYAFGSAFNNIAGGEILLLNKNFDSIGIENIPRGINYYYSPLYLSDTSIMVCGIGAPFENAEYQLAVVSFSTQMQELDYAHFTKDEHTREYPSTVNGCSSNGDGIYVSGLSNADYSNPFFSSFDSWFHLIKLNSNLSTIWEKWYGGDAYYQPYSTLATLDGGCIMVGNRYDGSSEYVRDIFIVKVNSEGLLSWIQTINVYHDKYSVYPNPGINQINIKTKLNYCCFELYGVNGRLLIQKKINTEMNSVSTNHLNSGIYLYKLINKEGKTIETGKWIKR